MNIYNLSIYIVVCISSVLTEVSFQNVEINLKTQLKTHNYVQGCNEKQMLFQMRWCITYTI